jgi:hypothetical protein
MNMSCNRANLILGILSLFLAASCAKISNEEVGAIASISEDAFLPNILHDTLISMPNEDDVWEYFRELRGSLVKDSMDLFDISSYNAIFNIAERYIKYAGNDSAKKDVAIFGDYILLELTKLIEYNVSKGNLQRDSKELSSLCGKLEQFGHIPEIHKASRMDKLLHNMKNGNWEYIFNRIGNEIKGWF